MARTRATASDEQRSETLRARVEPQLVEAVRQLRAGNPDVSSDSEMVRLLIRRGIHQVMSETRPQPTMTPLDRPEYANRAAGFMEALGDLLVRMESHDPGGALVLATGLQKSLTSYTRDLAKRTHK
jgi:hypothetical protein